MNSTYRLQVAYRPKEQRRVADVRLLYWQELTGKLKPRYWNPISSMPEALTKLLQPRWCSNFSGGWWAVGSKDLPRDLKHDLIEATLNGGVVTVTVEAPVSAVTAKRSYQLNQNTLHQLRSASQWFRLKERPGCTVFPTPEDFWAKIPPPRTSRCFHFVQRSAVHGGWSYFEICRRAYSGLPHRELKIVNNQDGRVIYHWKPGKPWDGKEISMAWECERNMLDYCIYCLEEERDPLKLFLNRATGKFDNHSVTKCVRQAQLSKYRLRSMAYNWADRWEFI